jgi:helix-turn-helix protein
MSPKPPERPKAARKKSASALARPEGPQEPPLTLRTLRLCLAGRLGRAMTQAVAAKKAGISRSHLANIEAGLDPASQFTLDDLRRAYGERGRPLDWDVIRAAYAGSQRRLDDPEGTRKRKPSTIQQGKKR